MSKPNERSYWIFLEKLFPPVTPFFFWQKLFFVNFSKKSQNFFSMKLTVKNLENVLLLNSLKKHFKIFSENSKKKSFAKKKRGFQGGNQFFQENQTRPFIGF